MFLPYVTSPKQRTVRDQRANIREQMPKFIYGTKKTATSSRHSKVIEQAASTPWLGILPIRACSRARATIELSECMWTPPSLSRALPLEPPKLTPNRWSKESAHPSRRRPNSQSPQRNTYERPAAVF